MMQLEIGDLVWKRFHGVGEVACIVIGSRPHRVTAGARVYHLKRIDTGEETWAYESTLRQLDICEE